MTTPLKTRILLADDHALVRQGLRLILDSEPDLEVLAEASDGQAALARAREKDVDLAVLDVAMPRLTGIQVASEISAELPDLRILILSMHDSEQYFFEALRAGASGYVLKSVADRDLVEACRSVMRGNAFLYPPAASALVRDYLERSRDGEVGLDPLTARELEILKLIAEGHTTTEIAGALVISEKTVEKHNGNMLEKLGLRNRVDLTRYAIKRGLVDP